MLVLARPIPFLLLNGTLTGAGIWVMGRRPVDEKTDLLASIPGQRQPDLLHEDEVNGGGAPAAAAHDEIEEVDEDAPLHLQHDPPPSNPHTETDTADNHAVTQREQNELFHPSNVEAPVLLLADASVVDVVDETAALLELGEDVDDGSVGLSTSSSDSLPRMDDLPTTSSSFRGRASFAARATASNYRRPHGKPVREVMFSNFPAGTTSREHQGADVDVVDGLLYPSGGSGTSNNSSSFITTTVGGGESKYVPFLSAPSTASTSNSHLELQHQGRGTASPSEATLKTKSGDEQPGFLEFGSTERDELASGGAAAVEADDNAKEKDEENQNAQEVKPKPVDVVYKEMVTAYDPKGKWNLVNSYYQINRVRLGGSNRRYFRFQVAPPTSKSESGEMNDDNLQPYPGPFSPGAAAANESPPQSFRAIKKGKLQKDVAEDKEKEYYYAALRAYIEAFATWIRAACPPFTGSAFPAGHFYKTKRVPQDLRFYWDQGGSSSTTKELTVAFVPEKKGSYIDAQQWKTAPEVPFVGGSGGGSSGRKKDLLPIRLCQAKYQITFAGLLGAFEDDDGRAQVWSRRLGSSAEGGAQIVNFEDDGEREHDGLQTVQREFFDTVKEKMTEWIRQREGVDAWTLDFAELVTAKRDLNDAAFLAGWKVLEKHYKKGKSKIFKQTPAFDVLRDFVTTMKSWYSGLEDILKNVEKNLRKSARTKLNGAEKSNVADKALLYVLGEPRGKSGKAGSAWMDILDNNYRWHGVDPQLKGTLINKKKDVKALIASAGRLQQGSSSSNTAPSVREQSNTATAGEEPEQEREEEQDERSAAVKRKEILQDFYGAAVWAHKGEDLYMPTLARAAYAGVLAATPGGRRRLGRALSEYGQQLWK
ncbi:unnamed protein product [Amoebophrya sp. A120]|nr:unnamed protein product [Amoebophrya sp. A120]|eukprot:GSA120T00020963001.1